MTEQVTMINGWRKARLDECFDIQQGKQVSKSNRRGSNQRPFLRTANVFWGKLDLSKLDQMHFTAENEQKLALRKGDLLVCEGGDVGRTAMWHGELEQCYYQNHLHRLRKKNSEIDENFVLLFLQYAFIYAKLYLGRANITTIPNLSKSRLSELEILLPPLSEQKSIARILSTIQTAISEQENIIAKLKELKKSMMQHLFTHGTKGEKTKMTEIGEVPENWYVKQICDIAKISSGGTPNRNKSEYWKNGTIPWVKTTEINYSEINYTKEKITSVGLKNSSAKIFPMGTLLMAMYGQGATRGRVGLLGVNAATNQACAALMADKTTTFYLFYYLTLMYEKVRQLGHGANQKNLNISLIKTICIPICHVDEMKKIVIVLKAIDQKIEVSQEKLSIYQNLFKTLLHELMSGEGRVKV